MEDTTNHEEMKNEVIIGGKKPRRIRMEENLKPEGEWVLPSAFPLNGAHIHTPITTFLSAFINVKSYIKSLKGNVFFTIVLFSLFLLSKALT